MHKFSTAATKSSVVLYAPTAFRSVSLLNVPYSTFAGASLASLVRSALSSLRDKNLCINRARFVRERTPLLSGNCPQQKCTKYREKARKEAGYPWLQVKDPRRA